MNRPNRAFVSMPPLLLLILLAADGSPLHAEPRSVQAFVAEKEKWGDLVGTNWRLEGRYSLFADREMRLMNCTLPFLLPGDVSRPRGKSTVVEVTGRLEREEGRIVFRVSTLRARPGDLETVRFMRSSIDSTKPQDWYSVAEWARNRGRFYRDPELLQEAALLTRSGLETEYRSVDPKNHEEFFSLVKKARSLNVDEPFITRILHEGLRAQFNELRKRKRSDRDFATLLVTIGKELPEALTKLDEYPEELAAAYLENPLGVYAQADEARRPLLHRLFYLEAVLERISPDVRADGSNGFSIAARIAADAPERGDLVGFHEAQELAYRIQRVEVMSRQEMLELAARLESREETERAREVKRTWLLAREPLLREEGARGLSDLAEDWITLLDDRDVATRFYMAAWKENRDYSPARRWLEENGYVLVQGKWVPDSEVPRDRDTGLEQAMLEGRVLTGMTDAQVRAALGSVPDAVTRVASNGRITELWVYETSGIMIRLSRRSRVEASRVDSISPLRRPPRTP